MPYRANVIEVMIASPSDVQTERQIARDVLSEWNAMHAKDRRIVLFALGWDTHSIPDLGDRPQALINSQVVKDSDLLVAIFWTRIGTWTGVFASGTVEEIEEHLSSSRSAMIYFSSAPVEPARLDSAQYQNLMAFKESLKSRGLIEEYKNVEEFRTKFRRQLAQKINNKFPRASTIVEEPTKIAPPLSEHAGELLLQASQDHDGSVEVNQFMGTGYSLRSHGIELIEDGKNSRLVARWLSAIRELVDAGLIEDRVGKGQVYYVTAEGFRIADLLQQKPNA